MRNIGIIGIVVMIMAVTGCSSVKSALGPLGGFFGIAQNTIETSLAAEVAGTYVVEIRKDDKVLLSESWACTKGADGKLTGCHKQP